MNKSIKLTEAELNRLISESVKRVLNEECDEGYFKDKLNQVKSGATTLFQRNKGGNLGLMDRFSAAKKNWNTQGEVNELNNLLQQLTKFIDDGQIDPNTTIAQLVGGKYNANRFGKLTGKLGNRKAQITKTGGKHYTE